MSKSLNEIVASIRNQLIGHIGTDDTRIQESFIESQVLSVRSTLLAQEQALNRPVSDDYYQVIDCIEVKCDPIVCKGITSSHYDTYAELPGTEAVGMGIVYLGSVDGNVQFTEKSYAGYLHGNYALASSRLPYYTIIDDKAFIKNMPDKSIKYLRLVAILTDPLQQMPGCRYDAKEMDFPMPQNMVYQLEVIVLKQLFSTLQIQADQTNNATDSPILDQDEPIRRQV